MISRAWSTFLAVIAAVSSVAVVLIATNQTAPVVAAEPYLLPADLEIPDTVWLDELTWVEVAELIGTGTDTVLVPTAGVEQNGPHLPLGKHETVIRHTSERVARDVGAVLVASPMTYVPEGDPEAGTGHAAWPGTLSVPDSVFEDTLEAAARSLRAAGFRTIVFMGDSAFNQGPQQRVAERLTGQWDSDETVVSTLDDYYFRNGQVQWLLDAGFSEAEIGGHAGIRDTAELLAIDESLVRVSLLTEAGAPGSGANGSASLATSEIGESMLDLKVEAGVDQLHRILERRTG